MLRALRFIILAAILLAIVWFVSEFPGEVVLAFGRYTVSASVPVAILTLVLVVIAIMLLLSIIYRLLRMPARISTRRAEARRNRGNEAVLRALSSIAAGDAAGADAHARLARRQTGDAPLALYVAGEAARLNGRHEEADQHFAALARHPHAGFLGWRGLLHHNGRNGAAEAAQLQAREAAHAYPGSAWLRSQRVLIAAREGKYADAARLTTEPRARAALAIMASRTATDRRLAIDWAREAVKRAPDLAPAHAALADAYRAAGRTRAARRSLIQGWRAAPHPLIAESFLVPFTGPLERARAAQDLAAANPGSPESEVLLARTAIAARLPGEAKRHIEAAAARGLDPARLARLRVEYESSEDGDPAQAQAALRDAVAAPPGHGWRCRECGTLHQDWQPLCRQCSAIGSLDWAPAPAAEPEPAALAYRPA